MTQNQNQNQNQAPPLSPAAVSINDKFAAASGREGEILKVAVIKALGQVQANATVENLKNYEAAKKALEAFQRERQMAENPQTVVFKTVAEAFRYAVEKGYRRTRQTMDNHIEAGFLARQPDGGLAKPAVDAYLAMQAGDSESVLTEAQQLEVRDQAAKLKKTEAQAEVWNLRARRERGELIKRSEVDGLLAQRAQFLRQDLESFFRVLAPDIIALVSGDEGRVFDLTEFGLEKLEEYLDRYSKPLPIADAPPLPPESDPAAGEVEAGVGTNIESKAETETEAETETNVAETNVAETNVETDKES